ncbi:PEP-CTERM sorting domain-containing protein [Thauera humireducens]|nr:PEP-CTERM sorting domain-containing protein [Thauera humireducens]
MKKITRTLCATALLAGTFMGPGAAHALSLPPVSSCGFADPNLANLLCVTTSTGAKVYVASQHDDYISYSVNALTQLSSYGYTEFSEWDSLPSFGSGQIVKLFSFNNSNNLPLPPATGGTGDNHAPSPDGDQTPKNDTLYMGEWPFDAVVTVGDLKNFLGEGSYSPVFSFDLNNTAKNLLSLNGVFEIVTDVVRDEDGKIIGKTVIDTFAFDNIFNSAYDPNSFVPALPEVEVTWFDPGNPNCDLSGLCTMNVDNNVGSGKPDFFAYAPTLDLRNYNDDYQLYFQLRMTGLDSGGEELALVNIINIPPTPVPEPGVLALLGIGLLGLGAGRRKLRS